MTAEECHIRETCTRAFIRLNFMIYCRLWFIVDHSLFSTAVYFRLRHNPPVKMQIKDKTAVVTGATGGIGFAIARQLVRKGARAVAVVDLSEQCAQTAEALNREAGAEVAWPFCGDVCAPDFRARVFSEMEKTGDLVRICVPAAGILRDGLAVKLDRDTGKAELYDDTVFRSVLEVNLLHPVYWAMQMMARIAEQRASAGLAKWQPNEEIQGSIILIGSVSSRGNRGQISYSCAKSGLNAAAKTLNVEGMFHGIQSKIIHPGIVNTPMAALLPEGHFENLMKPLIPLGRMIEGYEIADAVSLLIENPAISGPLWVDAGLTPMA